MRLDVLTLFPGIFAGYLGESLLKKAIDRGLVQVHVHDIRDWSTDKHHKVDDRPFGGGPGMVLRVEPVVECVEAVSRMAELPGHVVLLAPQGRRSQCAFFPIGAFNAASRAALFAPLCSAWCRNQAARLLVYC